MTDPLSWVCIFFVCGFELFQVCLETVLFHSEKQDLGEISEHVKMAESRNCDRLLKP